MGIKGVRVIAWAAGFGLAAGVLLDILAFLLARYGPEGDGWSLRGNGALVVPFGLGPALLAGAWTAIVLHHRGRPSWLRDGAAVAAAGLGLVVTSVLLLVPGDPRLYGWYAATSLLVYIWMLLAPTAAAIVRLPRGTHRSGGLLAHLLALLAVFLLTAVGLFGASRVLPPGS